jgi:PAS domain S-box-containing protein
MLMSALQRTSGGYAAALAGMAGVTAVCAPFHTRLNDTTVALAYLVVILLVATAWGSRPAYVASALGVLGFNFFFLPPLYTLTVADPQNWVALAAFLITAVIAGQLSALAKRQAAEAEAVRTEARLARVHDRSLLEASLDALVTLGTDGRINDVNSTIEVLTGRSRASLIGTDFADCFSEPDKARALYDEVLRDGFVRDRPLELRHQDGRVTAVHYNASLQRDADARVKGVVIAARSISTSASRPPVVLSDVAVIASMSRFVAFASLFTMAVGLLSVIGWTLGIAVLKSVIPGQVIIKPNAAIALVLCGGSLWLLRSLGTRLPQGARKRAGQALAAIVTAVGLASLIEHLTGWDPGIDQMFFADENPWEAFGSVRPGLMAPLTALNFLLIGFALLGLDRTVVYRSRRYGLAELLAFAVNTGAIVGLLDFLLTSHTSYTHIALQTAVALFVLSGAVACARPGWGLGALIASSSYGGMLTRRLWQPSSCRCCSERPHGRRIRPAASLCGAAWCC